MAAWSSLTYPRARLTGNGDVGREDDDMLADDVVGVADDIGRSGLASLVGQVGDDDPRNKEQQEFHHDPVGMDQQGPESPPPNQLGDDDGDEGVKVGGGFLLDDIAEGPERAAIISVDEVQRMIGIQAIPGVDQVVVTRLADVDDGDGLGSDHLGIFDGALGGPASVARQTRMPDSR